jgi:hypothetical protein
VLFLDEFTEFRRDAVEGLRQPLEHGRVVVTRVLVGSVVFPGGSRSSPPRTHVRARSTVILAAAAVGGAIRTNSDGGRNYFWTVQVPRKR